MVTFFPLLVNSCSNYSFSSTVSGKRQSGKNGKRQSGKNLKDEILFKYFSSNPVVIVVYPGNFKSDLGSFLVEAPVETT